MADAMVRVKALRWVSDDQPGWIEVAFVDGDGQEHRIIEKVPVLTTATFSSASTFPADLWIGADASKVAGGLVQVTFAWDVETVEGLTTASVSEADVKWL